MLRKYLCWSFLPVFLSSVLPMLAQSGASRQFASPLTHPLYTGSNQSGVVYDIAPGDLDGDGKPDLAVALCCEGDGASQGPYLKWFKGNGDGTYTEETISNALNVQYLSVLLADLNGDGKPDLIAISSGSSAAGELDVYLGKGDGTFQIRSDICKELRS